MIVTLILLQQIVDCYCEYIPLTKEFKQHEKFYIDLGWQTIQAFHS